MRIYWKALIGYGCVFWILLCISDFIGLTNVRKYTRELDGFYERTKVVQKLEEPIESQFKKTPYREIRFGWSLLLFNLLTFMFSILVCSLGRTIARACWEFYRTYKTRLFRAQLNSPNSYSRAVESLSKIPVMIKSNSRSSETSLPNAETMNSQLDIDKSCPNLSIKRSKSTLSSATDVSPKICRTLFKKDIYFTNKPGLTNEQELELQCQRLKEELHRLQTASLTEHAILSRKLDSVIKEKKEISKQLCVAQKENRAAKEQLEELLQEKNSLLKKLDSATKDFKSNTKTKKFALAKLEKVTNNVEELRKKLEQVSRDKEILDKKLKLLENEYNKLHERYISSQEKLLITNGNNENLPERDFNNTLDKQSYFEKFGFNDMENSIPPTIQQTANILASVSQTEFDMKKIQEKIKQLEKNLENLHAQNNEFPINNFHIPESELSLSVIDNTDSQNKIGDESGTTFSEISNGNSPRIKHWSDKVAELVGKNKHQLAKIQSLASKMQEKARFLGNIKEHTESAETLDSSESDDSKPKRLVSSSVAFKNFLKSLNKLDQVNRESTTTPDIFF